jgi:hypothetical protein
MARPLVTVLIVGFYFLFKSMGNIKVNNFKNLVQTGITTNTRKSGLVETRVPLLMSKPRILS